MINFLFIGNSFTARNNMPQLLADLAAERGHDVRYDVIQAGGASLRAHWNKGEAARTIASKKYDWVVLQEQSTLPVKNAARMQENVALFAPVVASSGAKLALYLTWARRNSPESQEDITSAYESAGRETGATVVPAGVAWEAFLAEHKSPLLHDKDMSHPTLAGSYLAASVFLAVLLGEDATGIETELNGVTPAERLALQKTAWAVGRKSSARAKSSSSKPSTSKKAASKKSASKKPASKKSTAKKTATKRSAAKTSSARRSRGSS